MFTLDHENMLATKDSDIILNIIRYQVNQTNIGYFQNYVKMEMAILFFSIILMIYHILSWFVF